MKSQTKIISLSLSLIMALSVFNVVPLTVSAAQRDVSETGWKDWMDHGLVDDTYPDFKYDILENGTVKILDYNGSEKNLIIPSKIGGYEVSEIGHQTFYDCDFLESVTIPEFVTEIGSSAFAYCSNLKDIHLPKSVSYISKSAFESCYNFKNFYITDIQSWCAIPWDYDSARPFQYNLYLNERLLTNLILPQSVSELPEYAFKGCGSLESVTIPDGMTSISNSAFSYCHNLKSVTIPKTVESIGYDAFWDCESVNSVYIEDLKLWNQIDFDGSYSNPLFYNGGDIYVRNQKLTDLTELAGAERIADYAFAGCHSLEKMTVPDSVKYIGEGAFEYCKGLKEITIPDKVTEIGEYAFRDCTALKRVNISDIASWCDIDFDYLSNPLYYAGDLYINNEKAAKIEIPDTVTVLKDYVFLGCKSLTEITIPNSVEWICIYAFKDCSLLTRIDIPDSVTAIGESAFDRCTGLTTVNLGESVNYIGFGAFSRCSSLVNINVPESVEKIEGHAFAYCSSLTNLHFPASLTVISSDMCYDCTSLSNITIPDTVITIENYAFEGCSNLLSVTVPNSVIEIGDKAFGYSLNYNTYEYEKMTDFIIRGYKDTEAERYADDNGFTFIDLADIKLGDADGDGEITLMDVTEIQHFLNLTSEEAGEDKMAYADVDKNGIIEIIDAAWIQRWLADMDIPYTIG